MIKSWRYFYPAIIWSILILSLLLMPKNSFKAFESIKLFPLDKFLHAIIFFVYGLLILIALRKKTDRVPSMRALVFVAIYCLLFGYITELLQTLTSDRKFEIWDIIADGVGGTFSLFFFPWVWKKCQPCIRGLFRFF